MSGEAALAYRRQLFSHEGGPASGKTQAGGSGEDDDDYDCVFAAQDFALHVIPERTL